MGENIWKIIAPIVLLVKSRTKLTYQKDAGLYMKNAVKCTFVAITM
jgi:hypothetical protein